MARQAGQRTREQLDELRHGVERAAESVLGDDAEQLKLAQSELDSLAEQLRREIAQGQGAAPDATKPGTNSPATQSDQKNAGANVANNNDQPGAPTGANGQAGTSGQTPGSQTSGDARAGNADNRGQTADARNAAGGGARAGFNVNDLVDAGAENRTGWSDTGPIGGAYTGGPLTGNYFGPWVERLRDVQTLLDAPDLRASVAAALERARLARRDYAAKHEKPDWAVVRSQILQPLVEVRSRVAEELARRDPRDQLAPIDRDPVPNRFADSVRRYYEELGKDKPDAK
jgi:hypothetical protein